MLDGAGPGVRPITAALWSTDFSPSGRWSMRAAISACSVSGIRSGGAVRLEGMRIVSSRKRRFPSVFSEQRGARRRRGSSSSSSASINASLSSAPSGSSSIAVARTPPPPHPGLMSSNSGLARQRRAAARRAPRSEVLDQLEQRLLAPVDVLGTRTSGCGSASFSAQARAAQAISCWLCSDCTAWRTPDAAPSGRPRLRPGSSRGASRSRRRAGRRRRSRQRP